MKNFRKTLAHLWADVQACSFWPGTFIGRSRLLWTLLTWIVRPGLVENLLVHLWQSWKPPASRLWHNPHSLYVNGLSPVFVWIQWLPLFIIEIHILHKNHGICCFKYSARELHLLVHINKWMKLSHFYYGEYQWGNIF